MLQRKAFARPDDQAMRLVHRAAREAQAAFSNGKVSHLYWIDTLCIPIDPDPSSASLNTPTSSARRAEGDTVDAHVNYDVYRQTAIASMARIYAGSQAVLVVDPELQKDTAGNLPVAELRLAGRSWCFSEGALAMKVNLKFADSIVPFSQLGEDERITNCLTQRIWLQDIQDPYHPVLEDSLVLAFLLEWYYVFQGSERPVLHHARVPLEDRGLYRFILVWNEQAPRSTTKPEDVAAIIAALLNLSAGEILRIESPLERMKALLKSQPVLPVDLLFCPAMDSGVPGEWTPAFPNSDTSSMNIASVSRMEVKDSGFFISQLSSLYSYSLYWMVPAGESYIRQKGEHIPRHVFFRGRKPGSAEMKSQRILL